MVRRDTTVVCEAFKFNACPAAIAGEKGRIFTGPTYDASKRIAGEPVISHCDEEADDIYQNFVHGYTSTSHNVSGRGQKQQLSNAVSHFDSFEARNHLYSAARQFKGHAPVYFLL